MMFLSLYIARVLLLLLDLLLLRFFLGQGTRHLDLRVLIQDLGGYLEIVRMVTKGLWRVGLCLLIRSSVVGYMALVCGQWWLR